MGEGATALPRVQVRIPAQVRRLYGAQAREEVGATTIAEVVLILESRYPGMGERLTEPGGAARRWVHFFLDGEDIRTLQGMATPVREGSELIIVPSIAGG